MTNSSKTITLPKTKYEILRKQASLYEEVFRFLPEKIFGVEEYTEKRIKEFTQEDKIDKKTKAAIKQLLKSL